MPPALLGESFELAEHSAMNRIANLFKHKPAYERLSTAQQDGGDEVESESTLRGTDDRNGPHEPFSWIEYSIFLLLGVAMLWAWNMFLAAAPYFERRFRNNQWITSHFQAAEISTSTVTTLIAMIVLSKLQKNVSYPRRIAAALMVSSITFGLLALSTLVKTAAGIYFGFMLVTVFVGALGTALIQNGLFAFASGYNQPRYMQAIMTGQGVAGVLPPLVQIISVATVGRKDTGGRDRKDTAESPRSAFVYFLTAVSVSIGALLAFLYLLRRTRFTRGSLRSTSAKPISHDISNGGNEDMTDTDNTEDEDTSTAEIGRQPRSVSLWVLFRKLSFLSTAVLICFAVTMVFPVFTSFIQSTSGIDAGIFIPLAFLIWNAGDLMGRLVSISPQVLLTHYPFALFCLAMARLIFIPLYYLCNIKGRGAVIGSDFFYLGVVQLLFGLTNGYLGSQCMIGAGDWVLPEEREAAGGFMGLMLVGGLSLGSLLSFLFGDV